MVSTKKAKETEKKAMMKMKKAAGKSHGSRPTVLLVFCGPHFTRSLPQYRGACYSAVWRRVVEDHDRRPDF